MSEARGIRRVPGPGLLVLGVIIVVIILIVLVALLGMDAAGAPDSKPVYCRIVPSKVTSNGNRASHSHRFA